MDPKFPTRMRTALEALNGRTDPPALIAELDKCMQAEIVAYVRAAHAMAGEGKQIDDVFDAILKGHVDIRYDKTGPAIPMRGGLRKARVAIEKALTEAYDLERSEHRADRGEKRRAVLYRTLGFICYASVILAFLIIVKNLELPLPLAPRWFR